MACCTSDIAFLSFCACKYPPWTMELEFCNCAVLSIITHIRYYTSSTAKQFGHFPLAIFESFSLTYTAQEIRIRLDEWN